MLTESFFSGGRKPQRVFVLISLALLLALGACKEQKATGHYNDPYTLAEIKRMMAYHGALSARFDGHQWWCLVGRQWVRIENGGALKMVLSSRNSNMPSRDNS